MCSVLSGSRRQYRIIPPLTGRYRLFPALWFQKTDGDILKPATAKVTFTAADPQTAQQMLSDYLDYTAQYSQNVMQTQLQENPAAALSAGQSQYNVALVRAEHQREQTLAYPAAAERGCTGGGICPASESGS